MTAARIEGLVSVILPVHDRTDWLEEALCSALDQAYAPVEVLLCDDGSRRETLAMLERLVERDPARIRLLRLAHAGPGPAREAGRLAARGEFIQYLDSDDRLHPEKLALQVAALRRDPGADIAYGVTRLIDAGGRVVRERYKWTGRPLAALFPGLLVDRWWCTHTPLYRRSLCDRIGPWSALRYSQDWEYDARAGALGARLVWLDRVVSDHRGHAGPRQTGGGRWLEPPDQVRFFESLWRCACEAGVARTGAEVRHFARWVFACARRAGGGGDALSARALLALARTAAPDGCRTDLALYAWAARLLGWRGCGRLAEAFRRRGRDAAGAGADTLRQSWMDAGAGVGREGR